MPAMRWRALLALPLIVATLVACVVAAAHLPDASWMGGVYDGGDGDELISLVWDGSPVVLATATSSRQLTYAKLLRVPVSSSRGTVAVAPTASRAPPAL
jgi:hypothetical protein